MSARSLQDLVRERVRALRGERGLTQEQLCERARISLDAVTRIDSGSRVPTLATLEAHAGDLDVTVAGLFADVPVPRATEVAVPLKRIVSMLEREPPHVQRGIEEITKTVLKTMRAKRRGRVAR